MSSIPIVSFNKGLVTPHVDARADAEHYQSACRVLDNFIARMYGSAERRPGTYYINDMRDSDTPTTPSGVTTCLLVPFVYSRDVAYVLEFTGYYIRIYYDDSVVDEIDSPYAEADLFELQFKQLGDVIWITHDSYAQRQFYREDSTTFTLKKICFNYGPFLKRNDLSENDGIEMTLTGTGLTLTNSTDTTYSAQYSSSLAYRAFDQNSTTYWLPTRFGDPPANQWISCQWDDAKTVVRVRIKCWGLRYFKVQGSDDGDDWTSVEAESWTGNCKKYETGGEDHTEITVIDSRSEWVDIDLDNAEDYTYWRLVFLGYNSGGFYVNEIQMSETTDSAEDDDAMLESSTSFFSEDHVGALFALTQPRVNASVTINATEATSSDELLVEGSWTLSIHTGWIGVVQLERKLADDTEWEPIRQWTAYSTTRAIQISGNEREENAYYKITVSTYTSGTVSGELTCDEANHTGICRVVEYIDETSVYVEIVKDFVSEETTTRWYEGAWSTYRGFPSSCCFIEDRCVYGGMKALPNDTSLATVWLSATGDYDNFNEGFPGQNIIGSQAFSVTVQTTETLQWVEDMDNLIVGTTGGTYFIRSSKMDTILVPNPPPICRQQSAYPCDRIRPVKLMKTMVYLSGRQVRELAYDRNSKASDNDLTSLCEQITLSPIVNMALQTNPDTILWCTHEDGSYSAFVYDRENNVIAWAEMPLATSGGGITPKVKSSCVIPDTGNGDDIYVAANRTILGYQVYDGDDPVMDGDDYVYDKLHVIYLEKFAKRFE